MKTYHEMTESVLEKAGTEIMKNEHRRRNSVFIAASGLCFALVLTVLGMGMEQPPAALPTLSGEQPGLSADATDAPQPVETQATAKIQYLSNTAGQTNQKTISQGIQLPLNAMIRVRDTRGLTMEGFKKALQEETDACNAFRNDASGYYTIFHELEVIASITSNGSIVLDLSECPTVVNIDIKTTEVGHITPTYMLYTPEPERTDGINWKNVHEVCFDWKISADFFYALCKDPTIPLESIQDAVTITVDYEDETKDIFIFDITVNEEGYIFVTQRGIPTLAA